MILGLEKSCRKKDTPIFRLLAPGSPFDCWDEDDVVTEFIAERDNAKWTGTTCCDLFRCSVNKVKRFVPKKGL
jgi:hypothetical protein